MIRYFDNCATTQMSKRAAEVCLQYQQEVYFNPSARSSFSLKVANDMQQAREKICKCLHANNFEVVFTSGGTEANNLGILGLLKGKKGNIVATASEHSAVYNVLMELQNRGYEIRLASVLSDGHIDIDDFVSKVDGETLMACFMHVNNETGAVNDIVQIVRKVKEVNAKTICFSDGVQAAGKVPVNLSALGVDAYTISGHKFHSGKGVGALLFQNNLRANPIVYGGGQEKNVRSGTEYVGGIMAMAVALEEACNAVNQNMQNFAQYKEILRKALADTPDWLELCRENCADAIFSVAFANIKGEVLLHMLEQFQIVVGTGSACSSKNKQSRIAKAIGLPSKYVEGILRISFSRFTTEEDVIFLAEKLPQVVQQLRKIMG